MCNKHNSAYINAKVVHKLSNEGKSVEIWVVGLELVNEFGEFLNVLGDRGGLFDVEKLAQDEFMLVPTEAVMDHRAKGGPVNGGKKMFHRLEPALG